MILELVVDVERRQRNGQPVRRRECPLGRAVQPTAGCRLLLLVRTSDLGGFFPGGGGRGACM